ncbi:MAG: L,D-transpeptidase [Synergistaceae bacterium]|nr:L,D-transpeptidase [Synergistaceae bacterium]
MKIFFATLSVVVIFCAVIAIVMRKTSSIQPVQVEPPKEVPAIVSQDARPVAREQAADVTGLPDRADIAGNVPGVSIVINKSSHTMEVFRDGKRVNGYSVAVGRNTGDKQRVGDMRTPEGTFRIVQIQNASGWTHDFRDGKGQVRGAYGPYFIRLDTPGWKGIGIHGTHAPNSIGTNVTEGCIRLNNRDVEELRHMVKVGDNVVIKR